MAVNPSKEILPVLDAQDVGPVKLVLLMLGVGFTVTTIVVLTLSQEEAVFIWLT